MINETHLRHIARFLYVCAGVGMFVVATTCRHPAEQRLREREAVLLQAENFALFSNAVTPRCALVTTSSVPARNPLRPLLTIESHVYHCRATPMAGTGPGVNGGVSLEPIRFSCEIDENEEPRGCALLPGQAPAR